MRAPIFLQGIQDTQNVQSVLSVLVGGGGREEEGGSSVSCDIKGTKQTVAVVATLGQVRQSSDYRSAEAASSSLSRSCQRQA